MNEGQQPWSAFTHDPRESAHADLRASDRDRDVVQQVLAEAYADGRLDRSEYDARSGTAASTRRLGDLPALVEDLVPASSGHMPATTDDAILSPDQLQQRAVATWESDRRSAVWSFLSASLICWAIWLATSFGDPTWDPYFPWPLFVMLGTGLNVGRVHWQREDHIANERRRLEKKQRAALEKRRREHREDEG